MRNRLAATILVLPLFFCSPQTTSVPVAPTGSALPSVSALHTLDTAPARGAPGSALTQQRMDAAAEVLRLSVARYSSGGATIDEVGSWSERLFAAQKEALAGAALSDAAKERVSQWKKIEALVSQRVGAGAATTADNSKAAYFRASAEVDLSRL
jgi:outer membrane protein TolC